MSQGPRTASETGIPAPSLQMPQVLHPRVQTIVSYALENQEKICYDPQVTFVVNFRQQHAEGKITSTTQM